MTKWIDDNFERIVQIRRYLHQHPELGFEEYNTSDFLKNILQQCGYQIYQTESMKTGFYCEYGDEKFPALGLRCDLDALPIYDEKTVEYRSKYEGVMHGCGHDAHMAIVIGIALWLKESNINVPGKIRFIFQPAEEQAPGGAIDMINSGAIQGLDHLLGIHILPSMDADKIGIKSGTVSAAVSLLEISMVGPGGHTSRPEDTIDLIAVASQLIMELESSIKTEFLPKYPAVISFGKISAGYTFNVIPSELNLQGTLRYTVSESKPHLFQHIENKIVEISELTGAQIKIRIPYSVPSVKNDSHLTKLVEDSASKAIGTENVVNLEKSSMGGDDFGFYTEKLPSVFFRIGSSNGEVRDLHVSNFDINEKSISTALRVLSKTVENYFEVK